MRVGEILPTTGTSSESAEFARELLMEMANYISGLEGYTVSVVSGYGVLQESGQKIQFLEARDIALSRPNRMRAEERQADGVGSLVLFDGSTVMVWHGDARVYAQADQPGSIDDTLVYFERDLGMRLPLAGLLTTRMPEELDAGSWQSTTWNGQKCSAKPRITSPGVLPIWTSRCGSPTMTGHCHSESY